MATGQSIRRRQSVRRAEGYLELGMPRHALETLAPWADPASLGGRGLYLRGEALRSLGRHDEAVLWLQHAAEQTPDDIHVLLALGWCYKRTDRVKQAIEVLNRALEIDADAAIVYYNLACYWSLAGDKRRTLKYLAQAIDMDATYRDYVHDEPDFDSVRDDPDFRALTGIIV
ncbi:MAG: hypothetical protein A2W31_10210 [Planctomycetes bacterium RBG_16_64_10]|nr:MAG: hypothetical protein A2W31_10210 [Planctomycetes bacterium RBG_16_64_10]